ncbi:MAG: glycosyltransferase [Phycisphaerales bacterium]|nr:glycosyltransferase [Phycisphaerales bacterium]
MRILMLGWEFPPFIAGGLGTACYGLTKALDALGHEITFVLPKAVNRSHASHVRLLSPEQVTAGDVARAEPVLRQYRATGEVPAGGGAALRAAEAYDFRTSEFSHVTFRAVPSGVSSPYGAGAGLTQEQIEELIRKGEYVRRGDAAQQGTPGGGQSLGEISAAQASTPGFLGLSRPSSGGDYGGDLIGDVRRYAELCVLLTRGEHYDVIHAHDWLTYPAGMAIARLTGIPLIVHLHSTEFDRSGENVNRQLYEIERRGMHSAMRVITVSFWTRNIAIHRYNVSPEKIRVVWNGVEQGQSPATAPTKIRPTDKIVLFLGRITMQKGPEYFIAAAKRVLEKIDNVKFVVAGSGDMVTRMIELAAQMGIGQKVLFTGFLRGDDVARAYKMADCYVMPSVSEPFGIAPLEAMSHDVPVIISKQSGVSEALTHVLKVDFWDVDEMANKIIAVLRHPPLRNTLKRNGAMELRLLTWDGAARKCVEVYHEAVAAMQRRKPRV